ncbi:MAG: hypothetical protein KDD31_09585, partial [Muricauda sp.]|nr:hypothetical protein [Allomuricauda sp.]
MSLDLNANKMIIPIVLLGLFKIYAQNNRLETLELGLIPITVNDSIRDYPDATKQQLKKVFANVEIIGLGENTHQDGATFREKTRLIKFLHEEMG